MTPFPITFLLKAGPPVIHSGIKDLKVLKTTQSGFEGFIKDQFTTLPEVKDRCFATQVYCKWRYRNRDVDFEATWYELVLGPTLAQVVSALVLGPAVHEVFNLKGTLEATQFNFPTVQNPFCWTTESQWSYFELINLHLNLRFY